MILLLSLCASLLYFQNSNKKGKPSLVKKEVDVIPLRKEIFRAEVNSSAIVKPYTILIYPKVSGRITKIFCRVGEDVKKGQRLFQIEIDLDPIKIARENYLKLLLKANAAVVQIRYRLKGVSRGKRKSYRRQVKKHITSQEKLYQKIIKDILQKDLLEFPNLEKETKTYLSLQKKLEEISKINVQLYFAMLRYRLTLHELKVAGYELRREIRKQVVFAPFSGKLASINVAEKNFVDTLKPLASLEEKQSKKIVVQLRDVYAKRLKLGDQIKIGIRGKRVFAKVLRQFPCPTKLNFYNIELQTYNSFPDKKNRLEVRFDFVSKKPSFQVPRRAIIFKKDIENQFSPVVFAAIAEKEGHKIKEIPVKIGMSNPNFYEIISGLTGQELIVVNCNLGMQTLFPQAAVTLNAK